MVWGRMELRRVSGKVETNMISAFTCANVEDYSYISFDCYDTFERIVGVFG